METTQVFLAIIALLIAALGYFLKFVHSENKQHMKSTDDFRTNTSEEIGKMKGKIELVELESRVKYAQIQEVTQISLSNLAQSVTKLTDNVDKLLQSKFN